MSRSPRRSALRKYLEEMDKESLIEEIERIVDKFDEVKQFYLADLSGDPSSIIRSAKTQMERAFRYTNGQYRNPKASKLNKIVRDFEKISLFREDVLDLLLLRLELSVDYLNLRALNNGAFWNSAQIALRKACTLTSELQAEEKYLPLLKKQAARLKDRETRKAWMDILSDIFGDHQVATA